MKRISFFGCVALLILILLVISAINNYIVDQEPKLYTLGLLVDSSKTPRQSAVYFFDYSIDGKSFRGKTGIVYKRPGNSRGYFLLDVFKNDHSKFHIYDDLKLPDCVGKEDVAAAGWPHMPERFACADQ